MSLLDPDGADPSEIILPDGSSATEVRDPDGTVVWSAETNYYLDLRATDSYIDLSANAVTLPVGRTFLIWIRPTQIGTVDNRNGPGIWSDSQAGSWNDLYAWIKSGGGSPVTSGSTETSTRVEADSGEVAYPATWSQSLDTWTLLGFAPQSDGSIRWYHNDTLPADTNYNDYTGDETHNINYIGPGYAGATNGGLGHKYVDRFGVWDRVLTGQEVADYYSTGTPPDTPLHFWPLDEGSGSTVQDTAGGADGTLAGGYAWAEGEAT